MFLECYKNIGLSSHTFMQKTKCQQHSVPKVINTHTDSTQCQSLLKSQHTCMSLSVNITSGSPEMQTVNVIPFFMLSQRALHIVHYQTKLSNGISSCQGILSVYRGRSIRQCIGVPLCQIACCSCCSSCEISCCVGTGNK